MFKHMTSFLVVLAAIGALSPAAMAEDSPSAKTPDMDGVCAAQACRKGGFEAVVWFDKTHFTTIPVSHSPYILNDSSILIFPGESIAIQFTVEGDKLTHPTFYKAFAPTFPAKLERDGKLSDNPDNAALPKVKADIPFPDLPPNTVLFSYGQPEFDAPVMLNVSNNLSGILKVDATLFAMKMDKQGYDESYTSTCPVPAKLRSFEMWPYALGPMILKKARLLPEGSKQICK